MLTKSSNRPTCFRVELSMVFPKRDGERLVDFLGDGPYWDTVSAELGTENILVKFHKRINTMLACLVDPVYKLLQISLIKLALLQLIIAPS